MSLNEAIIEDAALEWFGEQCRVARTLTPALSQREKGEDEAIRRLIPALRWCLNSTSIPNPF